MSKTFQQRIAELNDDGEVVKVVDAEYVGETKGFWGNLADAISHAFNHSSPVTDNGHVYSDAGTDPDYEAIPDDQYQISANDYFVDDGKGRVPQQ